MRKLSLRISWRVLALLGTAMSPIAWMAGCGSDNAANIPAATDGGGDGNNTPPDTTGKPDADVVVTGTRDPDASFGCTAEGSGCTSSFACCTANCGAGADGGTECLAPNGCKTPGLACTNGNECCTGSCVNGTCSNIVCEPDGLSCATSSDCCSANCVGGKCVSLNPGGKPTSGNPCTTNSNCASGWCNNGVCANPSFCTVEGDICSTDQQCCGGLCSKQAGATVGVCKPVPNSGNVVGGACKPAGELCGPNGTCTGADCCSRSCAPSPTSGLGVCQPESGCHLIGDLCQSTSDCCGVKDQPGSLKGGDGPSTDVQCQKQAGQTFGVCNYVSTVCSPAGALCKPGNETTGGAMSCSTKADCCAGNTNQYPTCQIDSNGIPRCTVTAATNPDGGFKCQTTGEQCASSADCCGAPCIPNPNGTTPAFVCGTVGQCQAQGQSCTSTADCCPGLPCAIPPGGTTGICGGSVLTDGGVSDASTTDGGIVVPPSDGGSGSTCALYGQTCSQNSDCCSGVPCDTTGTHTCHFP